MSSPSGYVTEIPEFPQEVNLSQAIGLIPKIAQSMDRKALINRLRIHDPVIRVFTLSKLVETKVRFSDEAVLTVALHVAQRSSFVRQLLIPELLGLFRFDLAEKVQKMEETSKVSEKKLALALMKSVENNNFEEQAKLNELMYLQTGNMYFVENSIELAKSRLSWQKGMKYLLRAVYLKEGMAFETALLTVLQCFEREDAKAEFNSFAHILNQLDDCKLVRAYAMAQRYYWADRYQEGIDLLTKSRALEASQDTTPLLSNVAAKCSEKLGKYEDAAAHYLAQNKAQVDPRFVPADFIEAVDERAAIEVPQAIPDKHDTYFIMTGFPRSGTTLLENALNAHPNVATCEETSSLIGSFSHAFLAPMKRDPERKKVMLRMAYHQQLYYKNLNRYVKNPDAQAIIDKTPIISANIKYMEKIFPTKRYIFSIRHPYDVVLSNYKQVYSQNGAMSAFNDIKDACVLYNKVMSDWFEVFPGETDRVCYIRYADLVNNFRDEMERALTFLGVGWEDEVLNFVEHSKKRAVRTPSYANVRKGLGLGVQTSWQNFDFLFDAECRALLDPWVEFFEMTRRDSQIGVN